MSISEDSFYEINDNFSVNSFDSYETVETVTSTKYIDEIQSVESSISNEYIDEIIDDELKFDELEREIYIELLKQNYIQEYINMCEENERYIKFMNDKSYNNILNFLFIRRKNKLIKNYTDLILKNLKKNI